MYHYYEEVRIEEGAGYVRHRWAEDLRRYLSVSKSMLGK
jgi:hypothetical protein